MEEGEWRWGKIYSSLFSKPFRTSLDDYYDDDSGGGGDAAAADNDGYDGVF